jgi:hypothetical protein
MSQAKSSAATHGGMERATQQLCLPHLPSAAYRRAGTDDRGFSIDDVTSNIMLLHRAATLPDGRCSTSQVESGVSSAAHEVDDRQMGCGADEGSTMTALQPMRRHPPCHL